MHQCYAKRTHILRDIRPLYFYENAVRIFAASRMHQFRPVCDYAMFIF